MFGLGSEGEARDYDNQSSASDRLSDLHCGDDYEMPDNVSESLGFHDQGSASSTIMIGPRISSQFPGFPSVVVAASPKLRGFDRILFESYWKLKPEPIVLPWEKGIFSLLFGNGNREVASSSSWDTRSMPVPFPVLIPSPLVVVATTVAAAAQAFAVTRVRRLKPECESILRERAIRRWLEIIKIYPYAFEVGRQMLECASNLISDASLLQCLTDVLIPKSTRTLLKRSADFTRFVIWAIDNGRTCIPVIESQVYEFLSERREAKAAPTSAAALRSALTFAGGVLGLENAVHAVSSKRIRGLVHGEFVKKRPLRQRRAWRVKEIQIMENLLLNADSKADKVKAGFDLMSSYSRLRHSDAQNIYRFAFDIDLESGEGYVEAMQRPGKTSVSMHQKTMFIPVVAPARGILKKGCWALEYQKILVSEGIIDCEGMVQKSYLLTTPLQNGNWGDAKVCSTESTAWTNELLIRSGIPASELKETGTHSHKVTMLSWCAKADVSHDHRRTLGYHVNVNDKSMSIYSRDMAAPALRALDRVLKLIREEVFLPDRTRSGYFQKKPVLIPDVQRGEAVSVNKRLKTGDAANTVVEVLPESSDSDSSESSSSEESDIGDIELDEQLAGSFGIEGKSPALKIDTEGAVIFQHKILGTLHVRRPLDVTRFGCGRILSDAYRKAGKVLRCEWPECKTCFGTRTDGF